MTMYKDMRDTGWAWVVLAAAFTIQIVSSIPLAVGVYVSEFIVRDIFDRPQVALFGSLQIGSLYLSGLASFLTSYFSHRSVIFGFSIIGASSMIASIYVNSATCLYFTFGIIPGFSAGVLCLQSMVMVNRYFRKRFYLASCITLSGSAAATSVLPPAFRLIIDVYGLKFSLFILAGLFLQGCVLSMCMRPIDIQKLYDSDVSTDVVNEKVSKPVTSVLRNPQLYTFLACNVIWSYTSSVLFVLLPNLLHEERIYVWQINLVLSLVGSANLAGKLICAYIFNTININKVFAYILGTIAIAFSFIFYVIYPRYVILICASLLFGLSYGLTCCTQSMISRMIGGLKQFNLVYSLVFGACALGSSGGPPFSGMIYNSSQSYRTTFLVTSGITFLSAILMTVTFILPKFIKYKSYVTVTDVENYQVEVTAK